MLTEEEEHQKEMAKIFPELSLLLQDIGITPKEGMLWPVFERWGKSATIKFMSDFGKFDSEQGNQFKAWLVANTLSHVRRNKRSFKLRIATTEIVEAIFDKYE